MDRRLCVVAVLGVWLASGPDTPAEEESQAIAIESRFAGEIALIDVERLFKEDRKFAAETARLKLVVEIAEKALSGRRDEINKLEEGNRLGAADDESPVADLDEEKLKFNVDAERAKKKLIAERDELYRETYRRVRKAITQHSEKHGIRLVLRFSANQYALDESKELQHDELLKVLSAPVAYQKDLDVTDEILKILND